MMDATDLTAQRLRERLHYDESTGLFTWLKHFRKPSIGKTAGTVQRIGYVVIELEGKLLYAHRLAFLYVTGEMPKQTVDHRDGNKSNNRWGNLRDVSHAVNCTNHHKPQGSAGMLGVARNKHTKTWRSIITRGDKQIHIGTFESPVEAHNAYLAARKLLDAAA